MAAEHDGVDALMAALTDDPLPEGALTDADFMAEHWSAAADVALLREQLGLIGDALAAQERTEPEPEPVRKRARLPVRERRYWRPMRNLALGVVAVAAAGTLSAGSVWLLAQAGRGTDDASTSSADSGASYSQAPQDEGDIGGTGVKEGASALTHPGYLACARLVAEGTVDAVGRGPAPGQDRITLRVTRYYKPDKGPAEVTFVIDRQVAPELSVGDHTLIGIPKGAASPDTWTIGEKEITAERARITAALPEARTLSCE